MHRRTRLHRREWINNRIHRCHGVREDGVGSTPRTSSPWRMYHLATSESASWPWFGWQGSFRVSLKRPVFRGLAPWFRGRPGLAASRRAATTVCLPPNGSLPRESS
eukprot:2349559-Prymnesium_polylepis.1